MYSKKPTLITQIVFLFWKFKKFSIDMQFHLHQHLKEFQSSRKKNKNKTKLSLKYQNKFNKEFTTVLQDFIKS